MSYPDQRKVLPLTATHRWLKHRRWMGDSVERKMGPRTADWCGLIDYIAVHPGRGVLAIQVCSVDGISARRERFLETPAASRYMLRARMKVEIWGWYVREWRFRRWALVLDDDDSNNLRWVDCGTDYCKFTQQPTKEIVP